MNKDNVLMSSSKENFIPPHSLETAVLFLIFNRLDTTMQVFKAIRQAKPPKLYVASDGPRLNMPGEDKTIQAVRDCVMNSIDWDCEVKALFQEFNLGCKYAVSGGINWFFENEEMGIILEDDCLPSQSFFWFCEELLLKFKNDNRIFMISGENGGGIIRLTQDVSYFFSNGGIWGWATWKRAWKLCDLELEKFNDPINQKRLLEYCTPDAFKDIFHGCYRVKYGQLNTWDYQWAFSRAIYNGFSVNPVKNLVKNIGFGPNATHTTRSDVHETEIYDITFPLVHNNIINMETIFLLDDERTKSNIFNKLLKKIQNVLPSDYFIIKEKIYAYIYSIFAR